MQSARELYKNLIEVSKVIAGGQNRTLLWNMLLSMELMLTVALLYGKMKTFPT
jgi:hypothetical protein